MNGSNGEKRQIKPLMLVAVGLCLIGVVAVVVVAMQSITKQRAEAQFAALSEGITVEEEESEGQQDADNVPDVEEDAPADTGGEELSLDFLPEGVEVPAKDIDWDMLHAENEDIYAWINIPGTKVDYPILQNADDLDYYLNHNLDHSKGYPGCIYTRFHNSTDFEDPNTVIYGHNMKDGSMFKTLHYFADGRFFAENPYIYIWQPGRLMVYEIFAAYTFTDADLLSSVDFDDPDTYRNYLDSLMAIRDLKVHLRKDTYVPLDENSRIVTLSTCVAGSDSVRYLVQGVRIGVVE